MKVTIAIISKKPVIVLGNVWNANEDNPIKAIEKKDK